ncbi:MAG: AAC(3) family N-acetyltransferase [Desulfobacteraceae bacterium]|nr:AAC(3) family N-acetyltransferase [Desulfobacteraceae bacterium]MBC2754828.1 AAC(3) family N-acetyltransferase [Desulfobacteraceae bacterium]
MLKKKISQVISAKTKLKIKSQIKKIKTGVASSLLSYDGAMLVNSLKKIGIRENDTVLVHANFKPDSGFQGDPSDAVNVLKSFLGNKGNLLMVSIPFRGAGFDYLKKNKPFRLKKTMSMMGLITEMFRRSEGVKRSLHPTHPVLVYGKDSSMLTADHEKCIYPCGAGSPFDKFRQLKGKILFYDVSCQAITFFHYVEDLIKDKIPVPVYGEELFNVKCIDENDHEIEVTTYTFNKDLIRNSSKLEEEMESRGLIKRGRVGNSDLILLKAEDVVTCMTEMVERGNYPYKL